MAFPWGGGQECTRHWRVFIVLPIRRQEKCHNCSRCVSPESSESLKSSRSALASGEWLLIDLSVGHGNFTTAHRTLVSMEAVVNSPLASKDWPNCWLDDNMSSLPSLVSIWLRASGSAFATGERFLTYLQIEWKLECNIF